MKKKIYGTLLLIGSTVLWGSSFAVRKIGMDQIGPLMQNAARFFAAFCFMLILIACQAILKKKRGEIKKETVPVKLQVKYGIIIGSAFAAGSVFQQLGLMTVEAGKVGFITSIYTVLVPIISFLFFKAKIRKQVWIGMLMSFIGLLCITRGGIGFEIGYLILLSGSVLFALHIILIGRYVHDANPLILATAQLAAGAVINLIMAVALQEEFQLYMLKDGLVTILYTGVFSLGIANGLQFVGQKLIQPSVAAIVCSFESIFGLLFGMILLGESMTAMQIVGSLMIFGAAIVSQIEIKKREDEVDG